MSRSKTSLSPGCQAFLAAVLDEPDHAGAAAFAASILGEETGYPNEPRDKRGRRIKGRPKPPLSPSCQAFLAAILDEPDHAGAAAFAASILGEDTGYPNEACDENSRRSTGGSQPSTPSARDVFIAAVLREHNFDPNEPRDERGRWTTGGAGTSRAPLDPADLLLKGRGKHVVPQSQTCATWTDRQGAVHTENGTTAADLRAIIGRIRAAGGTIDHLIVKGHGGPEGMTDDNNVGTLVPDPDNNLIISDGHDIAPDLRQITNAQSQLSLRGCSTDQAADDTARILGNGATISGNWWPSVGIPGTPWDASLRWSNHSYPRGQ